MSELYKALVEVQKNLPKITKDNKVKAGAMKYEYADLTTVHNEVLPLLTKHNLAWITAPTVSDGEPVLHYELVHISGDKITGDFPLPKDLASQKMGSAITYARRYALLAVTGVAPEGEDDDGAKATQSAPPRATREADKVQIVESAGKQISDIKQRILALVDGGPAEVSKIGNDLFKNTSWANDMDSLRKLEAHLKEGKSNG